MNIDLGNLTSRIQCDQDFIRYEPGACTGCGRCAVLCVSGLWSMVDGIAQLGQEHRSLCFECAACFHVCPTRAIDFRYPAGGTGIEYQQG